MRDGDFAIVPLKSPETHANSRAQSVLLKIPMNSATVPVPDESSTFDNVRKTPSALSLNSRTTITYCLSAEEISANAISHRPSPHHSSQPLPSTQRQSKYANLQCTPPNAHPETTHEPPVPNLYDSSSSKQQLAVQPTSQ